MNGSNGSNGHSSYDFSPKLDLILERMDYQDKEIAEIKISVSKVSDLVSDPERGVYGRVKTLETSKKNNSKIFWIVFSSLVSLACSSAIWAKVFVK